MERPIFETRKFSGELLSNQHILFNGPHQCIREMLVRGILHPSPAILWWLAFEMYLQEKKNDDPWYSLTVKSYVLKTPSWHTMMCIYLQYTNQIAEDIIVPA